ncbi:terminase small subunit [Comamonas sp. GB3 AK4-5]|uniref:terminase small subunit n=1 Tax=Comamonas sp. GB3 AK4-5 TaxID=3231487 RepID=UPI00351E24DF
MALTPKQERFVAEYLIDLNATQAAIRASYSARTAASQGERLLRNVEVAKAIQAAQAARAARTEITQDRVLQELARIAFFDIRKLYRDDGTMKDPHEMDADTAAALASIEVKEELERGEVDEELEDQPHGGALKRKRGELVAGYTIKAKVFDKGSALQLAMRHLGMLNDKLGLSAPGGGPIETVTRVTRTIIDPKA